MPKLVGAAGCTLMIGAAGCALKVSAAEHGLVGAAACKQRVAAAWCGQVGAEGVLGLCPCGSGFALAAQALPSQFMLRAHS